MADDVNIGGAKLTITADSGPAEKAVASFFGWFERTGEKATELANKISSVAERAEDLGKKGTASTKSMVTSYTDLKDRVSKTTESFNSSKKAITDMTSSGTKGYQSMTAKITDSNSVLSTNSKQTFSQIKSDAKVSYSEMTKDSKTMNQALVISMKSSLSNLKSSFSDLKNGFKTIGSAMIDLIKSPIERVKSIPSTVQSAMKSVSSFISSGFAQAKNQAISQIQSIPTKAAQVLNRTKDVFVTGFNSVVNSTAGAVSKIGNGLSQLPSKASQVASNIKTGFINGIKDIPNRSSSIWESVKSGVKSLPQAAMTAGASLKNHLSNGFQTVLSKAKSVFPSVKHEVKTGVEDSSRNAKSAVTDLASAFGLVALASKAFSLVKDSVGGAIKRIDTLNNSTRAFENMGFTAKETKSAMKGLEKGIQGLPTALDEAVSGLQLMTASTQDIGKSQKIFNAVNDSILGFGGNTEMVNNAVLQMSQAFANGKMDAETWNSMMNSQMGPTLNAMAKEMGITTGELKSGLSEGSISVDQFQEALIKLDKEGGGGLKSLQKIAKDSTSGIGTSFQNMKTAIVRGTANVIKAFDAFLKEVTGSNIAEVLNTVGTKAENGFKKLEGVFKTITPYAKVLFTVLKPLLPIIKGVLAGFLAYGSLVTVISVISKLQSVLTAFFETAAANPFVLITAAIVGLIVVFKEAYKRSETFRKIIDTLAEPFKRLAKAIGIVANAFNTIFTKGPGEKMANLHKQLAEILPIELVNSIWKKIASLKAAFDQLKIIFSLVGKVLGGEVISFKDVFDKFGEYFSLEQINIIMRFVTALQKVINPLKQGMKNLKLALDFQLKEKDYAGALDVIIKFVPAIISAVLDGIPSLIIAGSRLMMSILEGMGINVSEFLNNIPEIFIQIKDGILAAVESYLNFDLKFRETALGWLNSIIAGINEGLPSILPVASKIVSTIIDTILGLGELFLNSGFKIIAQLIDGIFQALPNLINIAIQIISWIASTIAQNLPIIFNKGLDIVLNLIQGILTKFPEWFGMAIKLIVQFGTKLAENFPTIVQKGWELMTKLIQGIGERIPALLAMVVKFMGQMIGKIFEYLPDLIILGAKLIIGLIKGLWEFGEGLGRFVIGFWDSLKKGFSKIDWAEIGRNVIDGIIKGFTKGFDKAKKTVTDLAGNVGKWFSGKLDIHSPSRVMIGIAKWVPEGVAVGIEKGLPVIENAVSTMTDMMTKAVKDSEPIGLSNDVIATESYGMPDATQMQASAQQASKAGNQGMTDSTPQLLQTALNAANGILGQFSSISPSMVTRGADWLTNFMNGWNSVLPAMITSVQTFIAQYTTLITNQNNPNYQMGRTWMQNKLNGWNSLVSTFITIVRNFCNQVLNLLRSFYNAMFQTGRTWLQNLLNGWNSLYQTFINRVNQLGNDAINNLRSKSGGFNSAGRFLMQSLIDGINSMGGSLSATMNSVANKMVGGIGKGVNGVIGGVNYVLKEVESDKKLGNWTVPQYAKGTDGHPGGLAMINDQKGPVHEEYVQMPDGRGFIAKGKDLLVNLPKGAQVLNASLTKKLKKGFDIPHYANGTDDFDIFDLIADEGAFRKVVDQRIDYNSIAEPWKRMTKDGVKLMTSAAYPFAQKQVEDSFGGGSFDGAMNANNVYQYLVDIAQKVMSKFGGLTITSGYRPGDPYWHGKHQALDISGYPYGSPRYTEAANWAFEKFPKQIAYVITNGRVRDRMGMSGQAATGQWVPWPDGDHYDHIHLNGSLGSGNIFKAGTDVAGGLPTPSGSSVERWRPSIKKALKMNGLPTSQAYVNAWMSQIQTESGGNPSAIGGNDGLADGNATGLLQTKPGTFAANAFPGHGNIMNGFDNMLAAIRYAKNRYGANMLGVIGRGHGYENGGWITQDGLYRAGEKGKPEVVLPVTKPARTIELIGQALNYMVQNGSGIIQSATIGLSNMASNMTLNLADLIGVDTQAIRSNFAGSTNIDLQEVIRLLSVNNQLLVEIRDKESEIYMDKEKVGKKVAKTVAKEIVRRKY